MRKNDALVKRSNTMFEEVPVYRIKYSGGREDVVRKRWPTQIHTCVFIEKSCGELNQKNRLNTIYISTLKKT